MSLGIWAGRARRAGYAVIQTFERFIDAEAYRLAASLSFYALFSLFPLLLVAISVGDILLGDSSATRQSLIELLDVTNSPALRELIVETLDGAAGSGPRSSWGIAVGLLGAVFGASGIFLELDAAMEKLFRVKPPQRTFWQNFKRFLLDRGAALLLVIGTSLLLLFGGIVLSALELLAANLRLPTEAWPGALTHLATNGLMIAALALCYRVIPEPRVTLRAALAGAVVAGPALSLARLPLSWALTHLTRYSTYGVVGALLVLVTWFYVASCILLFGAAVSALCNEARTRATAMASAKLSPGIPAA